MPEPTIATLQMIYSALSGVISGYGRQRNNYFNTHIEPLQGDLEKIHADYMAGFEDIRKHLQDNTTPSDGSMAFLRSRRRTHDALREYARQFADSLTTARHPAVRGGDWKLVEQYCNAIICYLGSDNGITHPSWYSYFIEFVSTQLAGARSREEWLSQSTDGSLQVPREVEIRMRNAPSVWEGAAISGDPRQVLLDEVDAILDRHLPQNYKQVVAVYARLKSRLI